MKRGLGGISNLTQDNKLTIGENTNNLLSTSMKGDQFHGKSKVSKSTTISQTSSEAQQKIGKYKYETKFNSNFIQNKNFN